MKKTKEVMDRLDILDNQSHLVVKSNELIQKNRYNLTAQQQKVLLYIISKIKPEDTELREYEFSIKEFCKVCGINGSGKNYDDLKKTISDLNANNFWLKVGGHEKLCNWVKYADMCEGNGLVTIELDKNLAPYLLQLRENFTSYELCYALAMKGKYAVRLYEILKSYAYIGFVEYKVERLKETLDTAEYSVYDNFRRKVIDKAISEINTCTDLNITFQPKRTGRTITSLIFDIKKKESVDDRMNAMNAIQSRIGQGASNA